MTTPPSTTPGSTPGSTPYDSPTPVTGTSLPTETGTYAGTTGAGSTGSTGSSTAEQAQQAAGTAADEGRHVAGVAGDEARKVAAEATSQARVLLDEARGQLDDQTRTQRDRLVTTLHSVSEDLDAMASQGTEQGIASDLARQAGQRVRSLGQHLDGREPSDLLGDVRRFARDRPGTFLLGALAAGVMTGRLVRGARDGSSTGDTSGSAGTTGTTPSYGASPVPPAPVPPAPVTSAPVTPATTSFEDPLGGHDGSLGAAVPPNPTGRYEP